jgi:hypothetical protein
MRAYPNVRALLEHNTALLVVTKPTYDDQVRLFTQEFERFKKAEMKRDKPDLWYRIHWSGDIPDEQYARALRAAMEQHADINFWGYTRSFFSVPIMAGMKNCTWYLSLDPVNIAEGYEIYEKTKNESKADNLSVCYMSKELPGKMKKEYAFCPVDIKKMDLEGGCAKCRLCLKGRPVWFKS